jgi:hypothetical protein
MFRSFINKFLATWVQTFKYDSIFNENNNSLLQLFQNYLEATKNNAQQKIGNLTRSFAIQFDLIVTSDNNL